MHLCRLTFTSGLGYLCFLIKRLYSLVDSKIAGQARYDGKEVRHLTAKGQLSNERCIQKGLFANKTVCNYCGAMFFLRY